MVGLQVVKNGLEDDVFVDIAVILVQGSVVVLQRGLVIAVVLFIVIVLLL